MAYTIAWSGPPILALVLVASWSFPSSAVDAAVETSPSVQADSTLDGWGPYKFGMTDSEVRKAGTLDWHEFAVPAMAGMSLPYTFSMAASGLNAFGLHPVSAAGMFDGKGRLSTLGLIYSRGGLTPDGCKKKFEGLLTVLEAQYGAFEPGDDEVSGPAGARTETDIVRDLVGGQSRYRDMLKVGFQGPGFNPDEKVLAATAKRTFGDHSVNVRMGVVENPELPDIFKPSAAVLAIAPNLANPLCGLQVDFFSQNSLAMAALAAEPQPPVAQAAKPLAQPALPSKIAADVQAVIDAAKKEGLMGTPDPVQEAYSTALAQHDDEDAAALLEKMTPAQKTLAAYSRHDYPLALKLWTPLAEKGDADAAASIGSLYEYGLNGVAQDYAKAAKWRLLAATEGDGNSQEAMGEYYADGEGVPKDNVRAYMWLSVALDGVKDGPRKSRSSAGIATKRDAVAQQLSPAELAKANAMIAQCRASHFKNCG